MSTCPASQILTYKCSGVHLCRQQRCSRTRARVTCFPEGHWIFVHCMFPSYRTSQAHQSLSTIHQLYSHLKYMLTCRVARPFIACLRSACLTRYWSWRITGYVSNYHKIHSSNMIWGCRGCDGPKYCSELKRARKFGRDNISFFPSAHTLLAQYKMGISNERNYLPW